MSSFELTGQLQGDIKRFNELSQRALNGYADGLISEQELSLLLPFFQMEHDGKGQSIIAYYADETPAPSLTELALNKLNLTNRIIAQYGTA